MHAHTQAVGAELNPEEGLGQTKPHVISAFHIPDLYFVFVKVAMYI